MKKVVAVFGTRPEAIKMCPVVIALQKEEKIQTVVCVTGQHRKMLDQVLNAFNVIPDYDLSIMQENQSLFDITNNVMLGMRSIIEKELPDLVLVHGDTSTAFATALTCFYMHVPVGHVEAGLRTYNIYSPYPEEFNRQAVGSIASLHFSPTEKAKSNLIREGKDENSIFVTGNTGIDALKSTVTSNFTHPELEWAKGSRLVLLTAHRRENIGKQMDEMFTSIRQVVEEHPDVKLIYPVHLNPSVRKAAYKAFGDVERIHLIDPLDVIDFHNFMSRAFLILTDSGGIQEEAPSLGKPVLVLRNTTERPEGVESGTLKLVGTDKNNVYRLFTVLLDNREEYLKMSKAINPYGDGFASERIVNIIKKTLFEKSDECF